MAISLPVLVFADCVICLWKQSVGKETGNLVHDEDSLEHWIATRMLRYIHTYMYVHVRSCVYYACTCTTKIHVCVQYMCLHVCVQYVHIIRDVPTRVL